MPSRKKTKIEHAAIVQRFSRTLRELRRGRGLTQAELAHAAHVTVSYVGRLESAGAAPGIDLVDRLSVALGCTVADLLPAADPPDTDAVVKAQARRLFEGLLDADRETLLLLVQLLARLAHSDR